MTIERKTAAAFLICAGMSIGAGWVASGQAAAEGQSFVLLYPGFSQSLFGVTSNFAQPGGYLGGITVLQNGDVIAAECMFSNARLHRFSATGTAPGTSLHVETVVNSAAGCGIVVHPDGFLYSNRDAGPRNPGIVKIDPNTGQTVALLGQPGNALGIAVDPKTDHIVYAGRDCRPRSGSSGPTTCTLYDLDPVTGRTITRAEFNANEVGYIGGLYFDPTGEFIFVNNRFPAPTLTIVERDGDIVQHVAMPFGIDATGVAFHTDGFVVTNNSDGSMTLFRFGDPDDDDDDRYEEPPVQELFAFGGFRGDLIQVGPDGCLYVTQAGTRYDDFTETMENSIVRICALSGSFVPPRGVEPEAPPPPNADLQMTVSGPSTVAAGGTFSYTFVATNDGGGSATDVMVLHQLAPATSLVSRSVPAGWTCTVNSGNRGTLTCRKASMARGETASFTLTVAMECVSSPIPSLPISATVGAATPDPDLVNNTAFLSPSVTVVPLLIRNITVQPLSIWPPNHRTVEAVVNYEVSGGCGAPVTTKLSVRSNEPSEKGPQVIDGKRVRLEASRRGNGAGRTYTVTIVATDGVNTARAEVAIFVPHDMGNNKGNPLSGKND